MSKRFGRNQKRALRLANNELAEMVARGKDREAELLRAMADNQHTVEMVAQILGENFAGLPPKTVVVDEIHSPMLMPNRAQRFMTTPPDLSRHVTAAEYVHDQLMLLVRGDGARRSHLEMATHFRFETPAGALAYAMSDDAYRHMPDAWFLDILPKEIARDVAMEIVKIRNRGGLRGR